ncbi:MAG: CBS domain-containing protein [Syntrophobacter sp.]
MLRAKDIMTREVISVTPETLITEVARVLLENRVNGTPVIDEKKRLVGIICQSDLISQQKRLPLPSVFNLLDTFIPLSSPGKYEKEIRKISAVNAGQAMTANPVAVDPETSIEEIAALMVNKGFHTIPVVKDDKLVGVIGKEDILRTIIQS